ncbi:MAG: hypothetical protein K0R93_2043 [Anaerosolibacter sp.]|uniref:hypothetical protein n=1 Tax=Anaerosolibacter sp. TaxID=1872527 RepID=UPI002608380E|nr:hypothetical protein [Anaerosolibacter sp.]MDF2547145.1 hypothetical protein [Anaerosolibacter sp.]
MKINASANAIIISFVWILAAIINLALLIMVSSIPSFFIVIALPILLSFILSIINSIKFYSIYKDFLTITDDRIVVNYGLKTNKKMISFSEVKSVKYNKNNMIFCMNDGKKRRIWLGFVNKGDEIALYSFLKEHSIRFTM